MRADRHYTRFSFFHQTAIQWNQPPSQTCSATSLETFKTNVAKVKYSGQLYSQNIFYLFAFLFFSSFCISLFLLICIMFFILPWFPFSHSTGDNPESCGHTSIHVLAKAKKQITPSLCLFIYLFINITKNMTPVVWHDADAVNAAPAISQCNIIFERLITEKKLIERSRVCYNHKPQPTPDTKRKRKMTKTNMYITNKHMHEKQTDQLFPKWGDHNAKRYDETRG